MSDADLEEEMEDLLEDADANTNMANLLQSLNADSTRMERVSFRAPGKLLARLDLLIEQGEFVNRSTALRAATRQLVEEAEDE